MDDDAGTNWGDEEEKLSVWVVATEKWYPSEVDTIWRTKERAEQQLKSLDSNVWKVVEWPVG